MLKRTVQQCPEAHPIPSAMGPQQASSSDSSKAYVQTEDPISSQTPSATNYSNEQHSVFAHDSYQRHVYGGLPTEGMAQVFQVSMQKTSKNVGPKTTLTTGNHQPNSHASWVAPVNRGKPSIHIPVPHMFIVGHLSGQAQARTVSGEFMTVPQVNSLYT